MLIFLRPFVMVALFFLASCGNSIDMSVEPGSVSGRSLSFQTGNRIGFPKSFGDQNFLTSAVQTANNDLFLASIVGDSPGWERWNIYRSTDNGATFSNIDMFVPYEEGESHPLSMAVKGNDLYVCGYAWKSIGYTSVEWYIRKTSDRGLTWVNSDEIIDPLSDHTCYDIDVSSSGSIIAVGENDAGGIIRESTNNGATWTTIFTSASKFTTVKVSPLGVVWAAARDGSVYKGTYAAGWTFNLAGTALPLSSGPYEQRGDLEILSETEALISTGNGGNWIIQRTVNGGANWATTYTSPGNGKGLGIRKLSGGEILAIGNLSAAPATLLVGKSTDGGATWNNVLSDNTPGQEGITLVELNNGSVRAFGVQTSLPYQITNYLSIDDGDTWSTGNDIRYMENLWDWLYDFEVDGNGNLWAVGTVTYIDSTNNEPWVVVKSSDDGATWTESDVFTDPVQDFFSNCIGIGPNNEVYVGGGESPSGDQIIRKTTDGGATWNEVDRSTDSCHHMTVASDGDVFTISNTAGNWVSRGSANGTVWNRQISFPVAPGSSNFQPYDIKAFPDGSLWVSGHEQNAALAWEIVIYRSTDDGISFSEVFREAGILGYQDMVYRGGVVYANTEFKVIMTADNGVTWTDVYDGTLSGAPRDFAFDNNGKLFVLNSDSQILEQNVTSGGYFLALDYEVFHPYPYAYMDRLVDCGSSTGICGLGNYQISVIGSPWVFIPLDY